MFIYISLQTFLNASIICLQGNLHC